MFVLTRFSRSEKNVICFYSERKREKKFCSEWLKGRLERSTGYRCKARTQISPVRTDRGRSRYEITPLIVFTSTGVAFWLEPFDSTGQEIRFSEVLLEITPHEGKD